jgi:hypothetical protein
MVAIVILAITGTALIATSGEWRGALAGAALIVALVIVRLWARGGFSFRRRTSN